MSGPTERPPRPPAADDDAHASSASTRAFVTPAQAASADTLLPPGSASSREESTRAIATHDTFAARYRVHELLGRGGMGEVRSCVDVRLGREVAVKTLRDTGSSRQRFVREARL